MTIPPNICFMLLVITYRPLHTQLTHSLIVSEIKMYFLFFLFIMNFSQLLSVILLVFAKPVNSYCPELMANSLLENESALEI